MPYVKAKIRRLEKEVLDAAYRWQHLRWAERALKEAAPESVHDEHDTRLYDTTNEWASERDRLAVPNVAATIAKMLTPAELTQFANDLVDIQKAELSKTDS